MILTKYIVRCKFDDQVNDHGNQPKEADRPEKRLLCSVYVPSFIAKTYTYIILIP